MLIYKIELFDGRMYIGQTTTTLDKRIESYKRSVSAYLNGKLKYRSKIIPALAKYKFESFRIFQIDSASSQEELDAKEKLWISIYNSTVRGIGFNIQIGGYGVGKFSEETKKKISEKKMGHPAYNKGKPSPFRGETVINASFTQAQADQIREEYKAGKSSNKLAKQYGVTKTTILNILNGKTYNSVGSVVNHSKPWFIYLIQSLKDDSIYTGITLNVEDRLKTHNEGRGARYTRSRKPFVILKYFTRPTKGEALSLEYKIKQMSREEKLQYHEPQKEILPEANRENK